jgi:hypothetical protein
MDLSRLRRGEVIAALSAVALFVVLFFSWYGLDSNIAGPLGEAVIKRSGVDTTTSGWQSFEILDVFLVLVILAAIGLALLTAARVSVAFPVAASVITTTLGLLATIFVLYRIVNQPGDNSVIGVKLGAWLGLLCCLGIMIGGYLAMRDEGTTLDDAAAQARSAVGTRSPTRPAPPADGGAAAVPSAQPPPPVPPAEQAAPAEPPHPAEPPTVDPDDDPAHHPDPGEGHGTQPPHGDPMRPLIERTPDEDASPPPWRS